MVNRDAKRIDEIVREALKQTLHRGVILSGWGGVKQPSSHDVLYLESAPHDWLLPKCRMFLHHGGAGTTSAVLRAGIPSVVIPFTADQPFWGRRIHAVGAGPIPILVKNLSTKSLVKAIAEAESNTVLECAQSISEKIRGENGVARAVAIIESHVMAFQVNLH
jgi:sterol 3beta-glucosyltransferase